ncbi:flagellar motor protein MotB [Vallitaleaceae bacterium 9-2]
MARKQHTDDGPKGSPAWMSTYGDMVTLLLCFFVLLFSMSSVDIAKFKAAMSSFADQIDVLPGGEALTDGELLNNGVSQLSDIQIIIQGNMNLNQNQDNTLPEDQDTDIDEDVDSLEENTEEFIRAGKIAQEIEEQIRNEGYNADVVAISYTSNYVKMTLQGEFLFDSGKANLRSEAVSAIEVIATILKEQQYNAYDIQIEGHTDNLNINNAQFPNNWILSSYRAYAVLEELLEAHDFDPEKVAATGYGEYRPIATNETLEGRAQNRRVEIKVVLDSDEILIGDSVEEETVIQGAQETPNTETLE